MKSAVSGHNTFRVLYGWQ